MNLKKILFTAIQPTGSMTLGNYTSILSNVKKVQNDYFCLFCVADLHAITVRNNPNELKKTTLDALAFYLASGANPNKSIIFVQSSVYEHVYLNWVLNCYSYVGELSRMIQFKEKSLQNKNSINSGLLNYPILMASDVLLYKTNKILVGEDQKQHLEFIKKIVYRFNSLYGDVFTAPIAIDFLSKLKIMSLLNPNKKMSKSDINRKSTIFLLDNQDSIFKKIKNSVTDSEDPGLIIYDKFNKSGISNLLNIVSLLTKVKIKDLEIKYKNVNYKKFKEEVAEIISEKLFCLQKKFFDFRKNEDYLYEVAISGAEKAKMKAQKTIFLVNKSIGLFNYYYNY
ncbi:Tryptophan--tRNA ligase [Buchnera aphidicola (Tetraneura ulmi)]|uniref:tryptophan--tRNA ligase n=1 Tax=Buchnera aphidicola TaxID=9 RepID=UPI003464A640